MPRKKNSVFDKARQALAKKGKRALTSATKKAQRRVKQVKHNRDLEVVSQWRALNKVGALATKKAPSLKNLTPAMRRSVSKAYRELQSTSHYAGGRLHHPLIKEQYKTKNGQKRVRYKVGQYFQFKKTKEKLNEQYQGGVIRTKNGYIFEKSSPSAKIRIRKGDVIESGHGVKWLRKAYRGDAILKLYDDLKNGRLTLDKKHYILYNKWGWGTVNEGLQTVEDFINMIDEYERDMSAKTFDSWKDYSEFYFAEY